MTFNQEVIRLSKKTIKEKKDKKKKKDPNALKLRRVISNNLFVLKIIHKTAPSYLPTYFLWSVGNAILDFLMSIWLLREIVNRYELGRPATEVIGMLIALIAAQLVWWLIIDTLPQIVYPRYRQKIVERIQTELFRKAHKYPGLRPVRCGDCKPEGEQQLGSREQNPVRSFERQ